MQNKEKKTRKPSISLIFFYFLDKFVGTKIIAMTKIGSYPLGTVDADTEVLGRDAAGALKRYAASDVAAASNVGEILTTNWVEYTAAELIAGDQKTLVSAQGAGKVVVPYKIVLFYDYVSVAYAADSFYLVVKGLGAVPGIESVTITDMMADTHDGYMIVDVNTGVHMDLREIVNTDIIGDITGVGIANGDGSLFVKLVYSVEDFLGS